MSLFSFLHSGKSTNVDIVWRSRPIAIKGMITAALLAIKQNQVPVVFCYFEDKLTEVISFLTNEDVPFFHVDNNSIGRAASQHNVVFVCHASLLSASIGLMDFLNLISTDRKIQFLFDGHYPLPSKENRILERLSVNLQYSITFCSSIDEPSFKAFGADRIITLLDSLGMKEDESIEHSMVSKAMVRAREKIERMVAHEIVVNNEKEWFLKNVKQLRDS